MIAERIPEIKTLSTREKFILATELWDELEAGHSSADLDDAVESLLNNRHAEHLRDPSKVASWDEVKKRLGKL